MGDIAVIYKEMMKSDTECYSCRAISAGVLGISGLYLFQHRNNFGKVNSVVQTAFGAGLIFLSMLRALNLPPFGEPLTWQRKYVPKETTED